MNFYAHTKTNPDGSLAGESQWEPLFSAECPSLHGQFCSACANLEPNHGHLNKVAWLAGKFAQEMFPVGSKQAESALQWGRILGWWHDLGKFAPEWQAYLKTKADPHSDEVAGRVDHSTAGAQHSRQGTPLLGPLLAYVIAGHHAGLDDGVNLFQPGKRFDRPVKEWREWAEKAGAPLAQELPLPPLLRPNAGNDAMAFMLRFFFSCLVDADFLATEAFMQPQKGDQRKPWPPDIVERMALTLEDYMAKKFGPPGDDPVNLARESVRKDCFNAAAKTVGFFSLTVPTGGGKTLSSLLFALKHAIKNGLRRVILVIPFTSIIKQNADVFREVFAPLSKELGRDVVVEHHSKFDPARETETNRLATENWDAPIIVTTNVRFFESLFANRSSACRKLHRIARSVVIFDEVQALPSGLLNPIIRGLRCLVHDLGATAVLCTATQPAIEKRNEFPVGIPREEITEIIQDRSGLFDALERVTCTNLGVLPDEQLIPHILGHAANGCLVIVNTTKAAQSIHEQLRQKTCALHLSARMCPRHVMLSLARAKRLRKQGRPVVLVATQIVEAGVDISFPVVYRAECGLDSFAQAAGRCNRNGELLPAKGQVFLFQPSDHPIPKGLSELTANAAITRNHISGNFPDDALLTLPAIRAYFEHAIWQAGLSKQWDKHHIVSNDMPCFTPASNCLTAYAFKTAAQRFRLIDSNTYPVLIPWGTQGRILCEEIRTLKRQNRNPNRSHYRRAQQFSVQVYEHEWKQLKPSLSFHCGDAFAILDHPENGYDPETGLKRPDAPDDLNAFCL